MTEANPTFSEGQKVVYPLQGVGQVNKIMQRVFKGKETTYYEIYLAASDMTVLVPIDKAEELGIRAIVDKKEAQTALKIFQEEQDVVPADWKMRYQMNLDLLKKGSVVDIAQVVKTLYHRSKVKELPIMERRLFDSALKLLIDEISFSLDKPKEEVEQLIFDKLEE
ncbi:CarD family transcriptional regulator [Spirochaeta cellobiosiphila]|uniref:CarD family transcriptional regulator n=1 Tax=Spirochaeta cellobiosiphila TaxID=504483 RepID=UPI0003FB28E5|nr:CarD family transcriptional regulator [Spirochaeta cellobiosiphila]